MYYARKTQNSTRFIGIGIVIVINLVIGYVLVTGLGKVIVNKLVETQVVIIDKPKVEDKEPPPPPPVDVELPPPPPQVILPEFTFDTPPPPTAITQVVQTPRPAPPPVAKPAPPVVPAVSPKPGRNFEKPEYPAASIRAKEEGEVTVSVCVDERGRMSNVQIVKSSGFERLDQATVAGLPRTRMDPARGTDGKPMAYCNPPYVFTFVWRLKDAR